MNTEIRDIKSESLEYLRELVKTWRKIADDLAYSEHDEHSHLPSRIESPCERCEANRAYADQINFEENPSSS